MLTTVLVAISTVLLLTVGVVLAAEPTGKDLLNETFEAAAIGSRPAPWLYFADEGNDISVSEAPITGGHCLKLSRSGGTVWKPMVSGWVDGHPDSAVRLDLDWFLPALSDGPDAVLTITLRGEGNINTVNVSLGGPGGVAVPQEGDEWAPLGFPVRAGRWGHLAITTDPMARKAKGAFDLVVSQGKERLEYPNVAFHPGPRGDYPGSLWYSPTFHVGGGTPAVPRLAYVDNVRMMVVPPRD